MLTTIEVRETLLFDESISPSKVCYDEDERFEVVIEITDEYDIELQYAECHVIFKRKSDGKHFRMEYRCVFEDYGMETTWDNEAIEVFPYTYETTGYL